MTHRPAWYGAEWGPSWSREFVTKWPQTTAFASDIRPPRAVPPATPPVAQHAPPVALPATPPVAQHAPPVALPATPPKKKKEKIPSAVKNVLWYKYFADSISGKCQCCKVENISKAIFDAGHIVSESAGGLVELSNLRPICRVCNSSMGKMNMDTFIRKYGF